MSKPESPEAAPEVAIGPLLLKRGESLALAESCTGGLIAKQVTDIAGSSKWFDRGLVTYSYESKIELLGVSRELLYEGEGAVSESCALQMVQGLLSSSPAQWGIAVTGIAGPDGGSDAKPVGTVWFGFLRRGEPASAQMKRFTGDRERIREASAQYALETLLSMLRRG